MADTLIIIDNMPACLTTYGGLKEGVEFKCQAGVHEAVATDEELSFEVCSSRRPTAKKYDELPVRLSTPPPVHPSVSTFVLRLITRKRKSVTGHF